MRRASLALLALLLGSAVVAALLLARPEPPPEPPPARRVTSEEVRSDPASAFVADPSERRARAALFEVTRGALLAVDPELDPERIGSRCDASRTRCRSRTVLGTSPAEDQVRRAVEAALAEDTDAGAALVAVTVTPRAGGGSVVEIELLLD